MTTDPPLRAVIPAGGFGTRMLPATKSMPKEMMPVLEKPAIQWVVEEAVASGVQELVIITGRHKRAIEDHFDTAPELEALLADAGKTVALDRVRSVAAGARLFYVRQDAPRGLGHAVLQAEPLVRGAPFAVLLGDDVIVGPHPAVRQLREVHTRTGGSVFCVQRVPRDQVSRYGIVRTEEERPGLHRVLDVVEKPSPEEAPSDLAVMGRYLFTPGILPLLARTPPGAGGEIQLTDAMRELCRMEPVHCLEFVGTRYDVGTFEGWLAANVALALRRPDLAPAVRRVVEASQEREASSSRQ